MQGVIRCAVVVLAYALLFAQPAAAHDTQLFEASMHSALLTSFFNHDASVVADVLLPDDYYKQPERRFPTIYVVHAFDGSHYVDQEKMLLWQHAQRTNHLEFIVVFLDANLAGGHHVFADSPNYGPWGTALATEFIPQTDAHFSYCGGPCSALRGGAFVGRLVVAVAPDHASGDVRRRLVDLAGSG